MVFLHHLKTWYLRQLLQESKHMSKMHQNIAKAKLREHLWKEKV